MEALVPTLIAVLLAGVGDRPVLYAARLGDAWSWGAAFLLMLALHIVVAAAMATGGGLVSPLLNPNAKALLVAVALASAALASVLKPPVPTAAIPSGRSPTALVQLLGVMAFDRSAFIIFAFAVRGPSPLLTAIGGVLGASALTFVALTLGEAGWRTLPLRTLALVAGALLLIAAILVGLAALRLI